MAFTHLHVHTEYSLSLIHIFGMLAANKLGELDRDVYNEKKTIAY